MLNLRSLLCILDRLSGAIPVDVALVRLHIRHRAVSGQTLIYQGLQGIVVIVECSNPGIGMIQYKGMGTVDMYIYQPSSITERLGCDRLGCEDSVAINCIWRASNTRRFQSTALLGHGFDKEISTYHSECSISLHHFISINMGTPSYHKMGKDSPLSSHVPPLAQVGFCYTSRVKTLLAQEPHSTPARTRGTSEHRSRHRGWI